MAADSWPLVGRDEELEFLVDVAGRRGGAVVVAGVEGVGKSRLVADLLDRMASLGVRPVMARATRSMATIPFGPFAAWLGGSSGRGAADRLAVMGTISEGIVGDAGSVVVGVDDGHLLDDGSAALVLHLVTNTPAGVVVTVRTGEPCPDAVTALWKEGLAQRVELQPLSEPEMDELVTQVLDGPVGPIVRRRLWMLTEGAPLYLREVVRSAIDQGVLARETDGWRWRGQLAGSDRLRELVGGRLAAVDEVEHRALGLVAFGEPLPLALVHQLGLAEAVLRAEQHGFVVVEPHPDDPAVRFAHPLYGELLRAGTPMLASREHHRALAEAALAIGWGQGDPLRLASWLLDGDASPPAPDVFLAAADRALGLTDWELADRLAGAAEAAGAGGEARLVQAAARLPLGRWDEVEALLADLAPEALEPPHFGPLVASDAYVAEAARLRSALLFWRQGRTEKAIAVDLTAAARLEAPVRARVLAHAGFVALFAADLDRAVDLASRANRDAGTAVPERVQALAVACLAWVLQGRTTVAVHAAEMALPYLAAAAEADVYQGASTAELAGALPAAYGLALVFAGRSDDAEGFVRAALGLVEAERMPLLRGLLSSVLARVALLRGRLGLAAQHGQEALSILREARAEPPSQWPTATLAMALAQQGEAAAAERVLATLEHGGPIVPLYGWELDLARCWVAAARGEPRAAQAGVADLARRATEAGAGALALTAWLDVARFGDPQTAAGPVTTLAAAVEGPVAPITARFVRGLAAGDGHALDAVGVQLESIGARLLAAEAAAAAARAHLADGRRGSHMSSLARARTLVDGCEGARTPGLRDLDADPVLALLTVREREVVELAARGLSNREIGERLYVSIRTVNTHLYRAYAKLGLNDRSELAALLPTST